MRKIVAGNWKMNLTLQEGKDIIAHVMKRALPSGVEVIFGVPYPYLHPACNAVKHKQNYAISAQDCHIEASGAFTGNVSAKMIQSCGAEYVIIGHSERKLYESESPTEFKVKIDRAIENGLKPIFCCGETMDSRKDEMHFEDVVEQIERSMGHLTPEQAQSCIIAYEPIWAIGTGVTATPSEAQEMHANIRKWLGEHYSPATAQIVPILYGGSCKPANAKALFSQQDINGGLIGGAALNGDDFLAIINAF